MKAKNYFLMPVAEPAPDMMPSVVSEIPMMPKAPAEMMVPAVMAEVPVQVRTMMMSMVMMDSVAMLVTAVEAAVVSPVMGPSVQTEIVIAVRPMTSEMTLESVSAPVMHGLNDVTIVSAGSCNDEFDGAVGRAHDDAGFHCVCFRLSAHQIDGKTGC